MSHLVPLEQARAITKEIENAANEVLARHGYDSATVKTTYGESYKLKLESAPLNEGPGGINLNSPEARDYLNEARYRDDLSPDALGRKFTQGGETYIFAGYVHRRPKYPFVAIRERDGRSFKFTDAIKVHLR